jgi:transaldolase
VLSVTEIYNYYKHFDYPTEVMGASFRNLGEICELAGCDLLTIAPKFLEELKNTEGELPRKLSVESAKSQEIERIEMSKEVFDAIHADDEMATEKLAEGIEKFAAAQVALEEMLTDRLG